MAPPGPLDVSDCDIFRQSGLEKVVKLKREQSGEDVVFEDELSRLSKNGK